MRINAIKSTINQQTAKKNKNLQLNSEKYKVSFKGQEVFNYSRQILDSAVFGFDEQKDKLVTTFFEPYIESFKNPTIATPSAILLYGLDLGVIQKLINGITIGLNNLNLPTCFWLNSNMPANEFVSGISECLKRFIGVAKNNMKFAIVIKEPEKYIGMSENQARTLVNFDFDEEDKAILATNNNNSDNINYLKSLLDNCSKHPLEGGYGTTLILATDKPHIIHPDLRRGKVERIEVGRVLDKEVGITLLNIVEQVRGQFKMEIQNKYDNNSTLLKRLNTLNPIDNKFFINQLFKLSVTNARGAFTEDDLYNLVMESFLNTLQDPLNTTGNIYLGFNLGMWKRSLAPDKIAKMNNISRLFNKTFFQKLVEKESIGSITEEETKTLNNLREARSIDKLILIARQAKEDLTAYEDAYLKELMQDEY